MTSPARSPLSSRRVLVARHPFADYHRRLPLDAPELPAGVKGSVALQLLRDLLAQAGLDRPRLGTGDWNPLGDLVRRGDRVLIKPDWVLHHNRSGQSIECLVTHVSFISSLLHYVLRAGPSRVVIGDAPLPDCDFPRLFTSAGLSELRASRDRGPAQVTLVDFRSSILQKGLLSLEPGPSARGDNDYVLFELGRHSPTEPLSQKSGRFCVTISDPRLMRATHGPGVRRYLIAREAMESDVVFNLPKLKTHDKTGISGSLQNMIGINDRKDDLHHHRKGGSASGGDCHPGRSLLKGLAETVLDHTSRFGPPLAVCMRGARVLDLASRFLGLLGNGSWHGNDTIWRTCLDIQRILRYGDARGRLHDTPQRRIYCIADAVLAGEGEGPLSLHPVPLGVATLAASAAASDWVCALLMGFDPARIPVIAHAFDVQDHPLADFGPEEIEVTLNGAKVEMGFLTSECSVPFTPPPGWAQHLRGRT